MKKLYAIVICFLAFSLVLKHFFLKESYAVIDDEQILPKHKYFCHKVTKIVYEYDIVNRPLVNIEGAYIPCTTAHMTTHQLNKHNK